MSDIEEVPEREPTPLTDAEIADLLSRPDPETPDPAPLGELRTVSDDDHVIAANDDAIELDVEALYNALGNAQVRMILMMRLTNREKLTLARSAVAGFFDKRQVKALFLMVQELGQSAKTLRDQLRFEMANQAELRAEVLGKVIVRMTEFCPKDQRAEIIAVINGKREWDEDENDPIKPMRFSR